MNIKVIKNRFIRNPKAAPNNEMNIPDTINRVALDLPLSYFFSISPRSPFSSFRFPNCSFF